MSAPRIHWAPGDDPELAAANERARATFRYFWRELSWERRRVIPGLEIAAAKVALSDHGVAPTGTTHHVEHMWVDHPSFDGRTIRGVLLNEPFQLKTLQKGAAVEFAPANLDDWIYAINGKAYGAFTVQVLRERMSPAERRAHDEAWGFDFGDPHRVAVVPANFRSKGGVFTRLFSRPAEADPNAEHPMSVNCESKYRAHLARAPEALKVCSEDGFTPLHDFALAGSAVGVRLCLEFGADTQVRTKLGLTALDLAETLNWTRVVSLLRSPD